MGHFNLFQVFWGVSVNTGRYSRFGRHEICALKKKICSKNQNKFTFCKPKNLKRKKKKRRNEQGICIAKKKNRIEKFETQLEKRHCRTSTGRRHRNEQRGRRVDEDVKV